VRIIEGLQHCNLTLLTVEGLAHALRFLCAVTHSYGGRGSFTCGTWLIYTWDVTPWYVGCDSFTCVTHSHVWLDSCMRSVSPVCSDRVLRGMWLIYRWDVTHPCMGHDSYVGHGSFTCEMWLLYIWDMTHSCVCHDSFIGVTWLIHRCDMTHSCVTSDSFICVTWLIHTHSMTPSCVMWFIHGCDMTYACLWHGSVICLTWLFGVVRHAIKCDKCHTLWSRAWLLQNTCDTESLCYTASQCHSGTHGDTNIYRYKSRVS